MLKEALAKITETGNILFRYMFEYAFPCFMAKIQTVECCIAFFQHVDHPQRLQIVFKATMLLHTIIQGILTGMSERCMAQIVRQGDGFDQIFIEPQISCYRTSDLRHFQAVRKARAEQVSFMIDEYLGFILQSPESRRMNDAIAIALKLAATSRCSLGDDTATGIVC